MDWNPREKYTKLVGRIQTILKDSDQRTARDVYYALEARGYDYDYEEVKRAVKKGRRANYIDPRKIVDTSREAVTTVNSGYDDPHEFLDQRVDGIWNSYTESHWRDQDTYVEVWLEKASLAPVFKEITEKWNVRLEATRGDWSDSKIYRATKRLANRIYEGHDVVILYYGDLQPIGVPRSGRCADDDGSLWA